MKRRAWGRFLAYVPRPHNPPAPAIPAPAFVPAPPDPAGDRTAGRAGAVRYLNSKPLIAGLAARIAPAELALDHPGRLADGLRRGDYDAALVPSVAALSIPGAVILPDACVAARGPVRSVKVYFRKPPGDVRTLALDAGSRTSSVLCRLLLAERYGVEPRRSPLPVAPAASPDAAAVSLSRTDADAVLLIGDRAMHDPPGDFAAVWDLGGEWNDWTGLPFTFAVWAGPAGRCERFAGAFAAARDAGVAAIDRLAAAHGPPLGLSAPDAADYLRHNLHFTLGPAERAGLALFAELCGRSGLLPAGIVPRYAEFDASVIERPSPLPNLVRGRAPAAAVLA